MAQTGTSSSSPLLIAGAWLLVIIPACWGLTHTVQNALKIFTSAPVTTSTPTTPETATH